MGSRGGDYFRSSSGYAIENAEQPGCVAEKDNQKVFRRKQKYAMNENKYGRKRRVTE
jgi:hypothetical protein